MNQIDVEKISKILNEFIKERDWDQFHSVKNLTMALNVEAGELMEHFQWLSEIDSNAVQTNEKLKEKVSEEIADIFIYLLRIANKTQVDIQSAVLKKLKKNAEKYPADKARGTAKKYTEL